MRTYDALAKSRLPGEGRGPLAYNNLKTLDTDFYRNDGLLLFDSFSDCIKYHRRRLWITLDIEYGCDHQFLTIERKLLDGNPVLILDPEYSIFASAKLAPGTQRTMFTCAKPDTKNSSPIIFIEKGTTHTMTIRRGENDPTWDNWHEFYAGIAGSNLEYSGFSVAMGGTSGDWIEYHVYPRELYPLRTNHISDGISTFIDRPIAEVKYPALKGSRFGIGSQVIRSL